MKKIISIVMFALLGLTLLNAQNLDDYGKIKELEISLENRIKHGLSSRIDVPSAVAVKIISTLKNKGWGSVEKEWRILKEISLPVPGFNNAVTTKTRNGFNGKVLYIDHIEVAIELDNSATPLDERHANNIAIEKAELSNARGDVVFITKRAFVKAQNLKKQLDNFDAISKDLKTRKELVDTLEKELKKQVNDLSHNQKVSKLEQSEAIVKVNSKIGLLDQELKHKIKILQDDYNISFDALQLAFNQKLDIIDNANVKKMQQFDQKTANELSRVEKNISQDKNQVLYWLLFLAAAFIIMLVLIFLQSTNANKQLKNDVQFMVDSVSHHDVKSSVSTSTATSSGSSTTPENMIKDLNFLVNTRKVGTVNYIKEALQSAAGEEKIALLSTQVGMKTIETLLDNEDPSILAKIKIAKSQYSIPESEQLKDDIDALFFELQSGTNDLYNMRNKINPFEFIKTITDQQALLLLEDEDIGTKALIFSQIEKIQSARILEKLAIDDKVMVSMEMAQMKPLGEAAFGALSEKLAEKIVRIPNINEFVVDGTKDLVSRIHMMEPDEQDLMVSKIKTQDPSLYNKIQKQYIFFNDILTLDDAILKEMLLKLDATALAIVMIEANETFTQKIGSFMNERKKAILDENINTLKKEDNTSSDDLRQARANMLDVVSELHKKATATL